MQVLAHYPITPEVCQSHIGRPIGAVLPDGDVVVGTMERVHDGHVVLRPIEGVPEAAILNFKKSIKKQNFKYPVSSKKAKVNALGAGYPYGWGYGNYGWGAGWWWIFPLFFLTALVAWPFFFW